MRDDSDTGRRRRGRRTALQQCLKNFESVGVEVEAVEVVLDEPLFVCDRSLIRRKKRRKVPIFWEHTLLRRDAVLMTCPNCLRAVKTVVKRRCEKSTHLYALIMLPACLCMLPYLLKETRTTIHRCPYCGVYLGAYLASLKEGIVILFHPDYSRDFKM